MNDDASVIASPRHEPADAIALKPIAAAELRALVAGDPVDFDGFAVLAGALPPAIVLTRALHALAAGTPRPWCVPFLIVSPNRRVVLGGCGFKSAPRDGEVEISYGVAPSERGRGIGRTALAQLLERATASGEAHTVVAHILPRNVASAALVARLGFERGHLFVDTDGEEVVRWSRRIA